MIATAQPVDLPHGQGVAFDTAMLARPTQRRLMALWTELSGQRTALLPQVRAELTATPEFEAPKTMPTARTQREAWAAIIQAPNSPFEEIVLDKDARDRFGEIISQFTLPCFPLLNNVDEITTHSDAIVLAQGLAAGMDVIISNKLRSVDHVEINGLVRQVFGRNAGLLLAADDALLEAHPCGEGSRALLVIALASAWPDDGKELTVTEAERLLTSLCERLEGATMPQTAIRLRNRFATDGDLGLVLAEARKVATASNALLHERVRAEWVRRRRVDAGMLCGGEGESGTRKRSKWCDRSERWRSLAFPVRPSVRRRRAEVRRSSGSRPRPAPSFPRRPPPCAADPHGAHCRPPPTPPTRPARPRPLPIPMSDNDDSPPRTPGDRLGPALLGAAYGAVLAAPWMIGYGYGWKFLAAAAVFFVASMFAGIRQRLAEAAEDYEMELRERHLLP